MCPDTERRTIGSPSPAGQHTMSITILNTTPTPEERAISLHIADTSGLIFGTLAILATCFGLSLPLNKLLSEHSTDTTFSISLALVFWTLTGFAIVQHIIQTRKTGDTHPFRLHILTPKRWQILGGALTTSEETGALSQIFRAAFPSPEQQNSPARTPQDLATYFRTARETRVMTQAHLAQAAGITTRTIQPLFCFSPALQSARTVQPAALSSDSSQPTSSSRSAPQSGCNCSPGIISISAFPTAKPSSAAR